MEFIGRHLELRQLSAFYQAKQAGLLILYGRRRVGKTALLSHWLEKQKPPNAFFWTATTHGSAHQLSDFTQTVMRLDPRLSEPPTKNFSFASWKEAFYYLGDLADLLKKPWLVVLDEFTNLMQSEPALPSILQEAWDHRLSKAANLKLVLTGSLVSIMEDGMLAQNAPMYGRATSLMRLRPLPFGALSLFFPNWTAPDRVAVFAVCGGIPAYISLFYGQPDFFTGLREHALEPGSLLYSDAELLLHERLHQPQIYESVLATLASGYHEWTEIARMAHVPEAQLSYYLQTLQTLEFAERRDPILAASPSRQGRYYVQDPFLRFYYRFIVPQRTEIARGSLDGVASAISDHLRDFIGRYVFEDLCREWVWAEAQAGELGFKPEMVGRFWSMRKGMAVDLDVVAAHRGHEQLFIGEAKWAPGDLTADILTRLIERSQRMPQVAKGWKVHYALFTRDAFSPDLTREAVALKPRLVNLAQIEQRLIKAMDRPAITWPDKLNI